MQGNILNHISLFCSDIKNQRCGTVNSFIVLYKLMDALPSQTVTAATGTQHASWLGNSILERTLHKSFWLSVCSMTNSLSEVNYITCGARKYWSVGDSSDPGLFFISLVFHSHLTTIYKFIYREFLNWLSPLSSHMYETITVSTRLHHLITLTLQYEP